MMSQGLTVRVLLAESVRYASIWAVICPVFVPSLFTSCFMVERIYGVGAVPFSPAAADTGISVNIIATNKTIDNARFLI